MPAKLYNSWKVCGLAPVASQKQNINLAYFGRSKMHKKVFAASIVLVLLAAALLTGNVLLGSGQNARAALVKACLLQDAGSCCLVGKQAQTPPMNCVQACCEAKKDAGTCPAIDDPAACPAACPMSCCPQCDGKDSCCAQPCCPAPCCPQTKNASSSVPASQKPCCAVR